MKPIKYIVQATTARLAWWPKDGAAWAGSGINLGYWTPNAETWFSHRMEAVRNDEARVGLRTQTGKHSWKDSIMFIKKTKKIRMSAEDLAARAVTHM